MLITDRRQLLHGASLLAGASLLPIDRAFAAPLRFGTSPFTLGVASGDPDPTSVVLWTRLAPDPMAIDFGMPQVPATVRWEMAEDEEFRRMVQTGVSEAHPDAAHSVHVVVEGLEPDRPYFYRFHAGDASSPVGRTRTTPARDAQPQALRYIFAACQRYENGYYAAWRHAAADNPDLILFLGDYIYEAGPREGLPRRHPDEAAADLASYRRRYGLYKMDADLQAAHAAAPWMVIWDDHEVVNNYKAERSPSMEDREAFRLRRAAAFRVWYEHMPVRMTPSGADMKIYRALDWGRLARFHMLDARQYATWTDWPRKEGEQAHILDSELRRDHRRSLLGAEQEAWLQQSLTQSPATWNVLAQQFAMAELRRPDEQTGVMGYGNDGWDGFPATRQRVVEMLSQASNPMVVGGDMHSFAASNLRQTPDGPVVAPAFVAGAISSPSAGGYPKMQRLMADNPDFYYADNRVNGYSRADVTSEETIITMRGVDDVSRAASGAHDLARFVLEDGKPGATMA
ncbi:MULTISPECIES: alkaline phosphatase D family protein [unclassified Brevundimonas]|uniref:alkaline phosphatase D family protein n=1 Tax=unclassified Brevundimonas TaxID=2622653 RepID=UPI003F8E52CE